VDGRVGPVQSNSFHFFLLALLLAKPAPSGEKPAKFADRCARFASGGKTRREKGDSARRRKALRKGLAGLAGKIDAIRQNRANFGSK